MNFSREMKSFFFIEYFRCLQRQGTSEKEVFSRTGGTQAIFPSQGEGVCALSGGAVTSVLLVLPDRDIQSHSVATVIGKGTPGELRKP